MKRIHSTKIVKVIDMRSARHSALITAPIHLGRPFCARMGEILKAWDDHGKAKEQAAEMSGPR